MRFTKVSIVTKVRFGFSLTILGLLAVAELLATTNVNVHERNGALLCIGIGLAGLLIWLASGLRKQMASESNVSPGPPLDSPLAAHPLAFLSNGRYWGMILILSAVTVSAVSAYRHREHAPVAAKPRPAIKRPAPKPPPQPVVTLPPPKPPVTFPRLRLEGLVVNQGRSAAIINGRVLWIGERIGNVRLVAVDTVSATVELDGQTNVLRLLK